MLLRNPPFPGRLAFNLYNSGIASLTVGCIIKGMLDIYGTTNGLMNVYFAVGAVFTVCGIALYAAGRKTKNKRTNSEFGMRISELR